MACLRSTTSSVLLMLSIIGASFGLPGVTLGQDTDTTPSLTVAGVGEASARPDLAEIQVGVITEAETAGEALHRNTVAMRALFDTVTAFKIADRDVQTTVLNVSPVYARGDRRTQPQRIVAYRVENRVKVKVRDLTHLGSILDTLVAQGANTVHGIAFRVGTPQPLLDQARRAAVDDARRKAELYAKAAGVGVGRVLSIQEEHLRMPPPRPFAARTMAAEAAVPVASGESTVSVRVVITYQLVEQ